MYLLYASKEVLILRIDFVIVRIMVQEAIKTRCSEQTRAAT